MSEPLSSNEVIRKRLMNTGLLSEVVFQENKSGDESGNRLVVHVVEKGTFFALPFFSIDAESTLYGLTAGKAGFFGEHGNIVGRYQMGTNNREASFLVKDEAVAGSPWILGGSFDYEDAQHSVFKGRTVSRRYSNQYVGGSFQTGVRLSPGLLLGFNTYLERHRFEELHGAFTQGIQLSHRAFVEIGEYYVDEGLGDGAVVRPYVEISNPFVDDFQFQKTGFSSQISLLRRGNLNWIARPQGQIGFNLPRYQLFELGGATLRSFPKQQFRDRSYGAVQNDLLLAAWDLWMLKLRPMAFVDASWIEDSLRTGIGVGLHVYFRKVAIPAVQFFAGYGLNPDGLSISAAIGPQL